MKILFIFVVAFIGLASAQRNLYGAPAPDNEQQQPSGSNTPQVHRHVYVHVAPDEPEDRQSKVIRVPGGSNKHVNIIFVKTPSTNSQQETEVILPPADEHKNLVYVLLKKGDASSDIKIRRPEAQRPTKPEVYFIRYKDQEQGQGQNPAPTAPADTYGAPVNQFAPPNRGRSH